MVDARRHPSKRRCSKSVDMCILIYFLILLKVKVLLLQENFLGRLGEKIAIETANDISY